MGVSDGHRGIRMLRVIRTADDYQEALAHLQRLLDLAPRKGTRESDELEILTVLIEDYERTRYDTPAPDPVEAIRFRMDQQGLTAKDLIPFIGSKSRVSEVLSGRRSLTLPMIRALSEGLGIPASSLIRASEREGTAELDWKRFPVKELIKRSLIRTAAEIKELVSLVPPALLPGASALEPNPVHFRGGINVRGAQGVDQYALIAWVGIILQRSMAKPGGIPNFDARRVTENVLRSIASLSAASDGPVQAVDALRQLGIHVVIVPALSRTRVDGFAAKNNRGEPIIGMSLRYDRLDNFWYTLFHELGHIVLHVDTSGGYFIDDLEIGDLGDDAEAAADRFASNALVPPREWENSAASKLRAAPAVLALATQLGINPAIVAGRIRYQYRDFRVLNGLVGQGLVRKQFPGIKWPA
jgi:HTH-type transcriptional regulator / antitoxin HigA